MTIPNTAKLRNRNDSPNDAQSRSLAAQRFGLLLWREHLPSSNKRAAEIRELLSVFVSSFDKEVEVGRTDSPRSPNGRVRFVFHCGTHRLKVEPMMTKMSSTFYEMSEGRQLIVRQRLAENVSVKDKKDVKVIRISVSDGAKKVVEDVARDLDMKETGVASRVYEWFGKQPPHIQKWVMGLSGGNDTRGAFEFAKAILEDFQKPQDPLEDRYKGSITGGGKHRRS
jgi:hypothetical protein